MAVYTHLPTEEISALLSRYDAGQLKRAHGIAEGVENSNYRLETTQDQFILTIFEQRVDTEVLPFYLGLMKHLAGKGIACPQPVADTSGEVIQTVAAGKKAAMVTFLPGRAVTAPEASAEQLAQVGRLNAQLHLAAEDFPLKRVNDLSLAGWRRLYEKTAGRAAEVEPTLTALIGEELHHLMQAWPVAVLPSGAVHADLFPDNIFFDGESLSGVIDFYFACNDAFAYDLAITINAWCFDASHRYDKASAQALLAGYQSVRRLSDAEQEHLPTLLRGAALRFLLTRLYDWLFPVEGAIVTAKDPLEYLARLRRFQTEPLGKELVG